MAQTQVEILPNGLTLAVEEQPWNPGVALQLLVPVGATTDPQGLEGATSVLEGWLWKGAGSRDARAFAEALDSLGVRRGSGSGLEYTTFAAQFLADKLSAVLDLYSDLLLRPQLPEQGLEPVRQVALQELASTEDQPSKKMFTALRRALFVSNHGRSPAGTEAGLGAVSAERLRQDFAERFGAEGSIVAMAGGVSFEAAKEAVLNALGGWEGGGAAQPEVKLSPPHKVGLEGDTAQTQIGLIYPDVSFGHPEFYSARLAAQVLSGGMGSRLFTEVRAKRGLVYSVYASPNGVKGYSYLSAYAGTTPNRADETLRVLQGEIERLAEGVSGEELERANIGLRTSLVMGEESARSRVGSMTRDLYRIGRVRTLDEIEAGIAAVDVGRINRYLAANPYKHPWVGTLGPKAVAMSGGKKRGQPMEDGGSPKTSPRPGR